MVNELLKKESIPSTNLFLVVGIGASAGGLEAFKQLIKAIPVDSGMAYILFQHLDPSPDSILCELLQKFTLIPVHEITDKIHVEPDNIYVVPPNKLLTANDPDAAPFIVKLGTIGGYERQIEELRKIVINYDFDRGLVLLRRLKSQIEGRFEHSS